MTQDLHLYTSEYTAAETVSTIPINIAIYEPGLDYLLVFLNGSLLTEGTDYERNISQGTITLTDAIGEGETVNFLVFKTDGIDIQVSEFGTPESRNEAILQNILGGDNPLLYPESRIETLLLAQLYKDNIDASQNPNIAAALEYLKTNWTTYDVGVSHVANIPAGGPVAAAIVYKYTDDYGAVLVLSYHPMFPHPAYCRMFAGEWTSPYWI